MRQALLIIIAIAGVGGCTSNATRLAVQGYRETQVGQQAVFDNTLRIANEQMFLNLSQFIAANAGNPIKVLEAVKAAWQARQTIEEARVQYLLQRAKSEITVGSYLYDRQGGANVLFEDLAHDLDRTAKAAKDAKDASGVGVQDIVQKIQQRQGATK